MPMVSDPNYADDPDANPRRVVAYGITCLHEGFELEPHQHAKGQLMMALRGAVTCEAAGGLWIVPPQCAIWIPGQTLHSLKASGSTEGYILLIAEATLASLPKTCCTVSVTPLLRELVIRCASFPALYPDTGMAKTLVTLLLEELAVAPIENLHLPMPTDSRLRVMAETIIASPADRLSVTQWARKIGLSERTMHRLLHKETGLSFSQWRQQFHIILALQLLAKGETVQRISATLGYESSGSFVTMFKRSMGMPPARYMDHRRHGLESSRGKAFHRM